MSIKYNRKYNENPCGEIELRQAGLIPMPSRNEMAMKIRRDHGRGYCRGCIVESTCHEYCKPVDEIIKNHFMQKYYKEPRMKE